MLLNEFLKEHRKNEEQEATIAQLNSGIEDLAATVKEQSSQIKKASAQLEANKPAPQGGRQSLMQPDWHQHAMCVRSPDTWLRSLSGLPV